MKRWCKSCKAVREVAEEVAMTEAGWHCPECGGSLLRPGGRETFHFLTAIWDVDRAKELVANRAPNCRLPTAGSEAWFGPKEPEPVIEETDAQGRQVRWMRVGLIRIQAEYAMSELVDLSVPVILVRIRYKRKESTMLIDGWHRLYKAWQLGLETLPGHLLSLKESQEVRLR